MYVQNFITNLFLPFSIQESKHCHAQSYVPFFDNRLGSSSMEQTTSGSKEALPGKKACVSVFTRVSSVCLFHHHSLAESSVMRGLA
jgi:hypothetical protein